jgi:hypothetical protein
VRLSHETEKDTDLQLLSPCDYKPEGLTVGERERERERKKVFKKDRSVVRLILSDAPET